MLLDVLDPSIPRDPEPATLVRSTAGASWPWVYPGPGPPKLPSPSLHLLPGEPRRPGTGRRGRSSRAARELGDPAPPLPGPRPLAVPASSPHTPPGPPEPRPCRRSSSFSLHSARDPGPPAVRRPCSLRAECWFSGAAYRSRRLSGPPAPLGPPSPCLANAAAGGGLMSLQHHAAAAEEGESYTRTEKHSS